MKGQPEWYDGNTSYEIMRRYGEKSRELEEYLKTGRIPDLSHNHR